METPSDPAVIGFIAAYGLAVITVYYCSAILFEMWLWSRKRPGEYDPVDAFASFLVNLMSNVGAALIGLVIPLTAYLYISGNLALIEPSFAWWTVPLAFAVHEVAYYTGHRIGHRTGLGWALHQVHHSSEELNISTASRGFLFGDPVSNLIGLAAAFLGVNLFVYLGVVIVKNMWGIFNHTQLVDKMGPLERWMATPANHRVHHARNPRYIDRNYSQVTIVLDRMLGTWEPETEQPDFGLVVPQHTTNPLRIWFGGITWLAKRWRSAPDLGTKLQYLWRPPEWHHEEAESREEFVAAE